VTSPTLSIELAIEAAPRLRLCCTNDAEEARLVDWIHSQEGLAELVARALELAEEARAA
jgi:hypothetical protein